jgi:hypothetical protein
LDRKSFPPLFFRRIACIRTDQFILPKTDFFTISFTFPSAKSRSFPQFAGAEMMLWVINVEKSIFVTLSETKDLRFLPGGSDSSLYPE